MVEAVVRAERGSRAQLNSAGGLPSLVWGGSRPKGARRGGRGGSAGARRHLGLGGAAVLEAMTRGGQHLCGVFGASSGHERLESQCCTDRDRAKA